MSEKSWCEFETWAPIVSRGTFGITVQLGIELLCVP